MVAHSAPIRFIEVQPSCRAFFATKRERGGGERKNERGRGRAGVGEKELI